MPKLKSLADLYSPEISALLDRRDSLKSIIAKADNELRNVGAELEKIGFGKKKRGRPTKPDIRLEPDYEKTMSYFDQLTKDGAKRGKLNQYEILKGWFRKGYPLENEVQIERWAADFQNKLAKYRSEKKERIQN